MSLKDAESLPWFKRDIAPLPTNLFNSLIAKKEDAKRKLPGIRSIAVGIIALMEILLVRKKSEKRLLQEKGP